MSDQIPHSPAPAYSPVDSREPNWTTGQGIGFLVALPGWILVGMGAIAAAISIPMNVSGETAGGVSLVGVAVVTCLVGFIGALPGTIVFNKCKRR